ncbi:hypothetical protein [Ancylobacter sp. IITR112]|uniref:hypothetical protein n=1 Tax=Ancylobacter sp. IITR112 TaxID=3138073 RepID=UPI003529FF4D
MSLSGYIGGRAGPDQAAVAGDAMRLTPPGAREKAIKVFRSEAALAERGKESAKSV